MGKRNFLKSIPLMTLATLVILYGLIGCQGQKGRGILKSSASGEVESAKIEPNLRSPTSREKTIYWSPFTVTNGFGDPATGINDLKVTVIEQKSPNGHLLTKYFTTWKYRNYTEDDRGGTSVRLIVTLRNAQGQAIDGSFAGSSPRNHCSYNPPWEDGSFKEHTSDNNFFDVIDRAVLRWEYEANYEGGCK